MRGLVVCPACGYQLVGSGRTPAETERMLRAAMQAHEAERHAPPVVARVAEPWIAHPSGRAS